MTASLLVPTRDYLLSRMQAVRALVEGAAPPVDADGVAPDGGLARIEERCGLSPFERDLLVLAAGAELDPAMGALYAAAHGDTVRRQPTFGLAMTVLDQPHWDAVGADGPLRRLALVEVERAGGTLMDARLTVPERVLLLLLGQDVPAADLAEDAETLPSGAALLTDRQRVVVSAVATALAGTPSRPVALWGRASDRRAAERALAAGCGASRGWLVSGTRLAADPSRLTRVARALARESVVGHSPVVVDLDVGEPDPEQRSALLRRLVAAGCRLVVSGTAPVAGLPPQAVPFELPAPSYAENTGLWRSALGDRAASLNGQVERVAGHFRMGADAMVSTAAALDLGTGDAARSLWQACRDGARTDLGGLARHREPHAAWSDLVLPERATALLRDILRHARHRARVYEEWRVTGSDRRGVGVAALFSGPSGTGKSLAAEVIATELGVDVQAVDLSQVVSRYVGETEKALSRVFDAAESAGAVLLVDEADALFGKRTEVRDSHDRYANIEVSYLLQRMESYRGLAVLTTNLQAGIDEAFLRRLDFVVTFPFPDLESRTELWRRAFGPGVPVDRLDIDALARLNLSGGSIRNVAVHAAFLAAEAMRAVSMADVLSGAHAEYAKLGRPLTPVEIAGWPT